MLKRRGFLAVLGLLPAAPVLLKELHTQPTPVVVPPTRVDAFTETFWPTSVISAEDAGLSKLNTYHISKEQVGLGMLPPFQGTLGHIPRHLP